MKNTLTVSSSPHFREGNSVRRVMLTVIFALLPVLVISVIAYGWRALAVTVLASVTCFVSETLFCLARRKKISSTDLSCVVSGMLFAFCLPVQTPYLLVAAGSVFATVIVKMLFGGLGQNFANPALAAKVFLYTWMAYPVKHIGAFLTEKLPLFADAYFAPELGAAIETDKTLLDLLSEGSTGLPSALDLIVGRYGTGLGESCAVVLLLCGIWLIGQGIITWHVPVSYFGSIAVTAFLIPYGGTHFNFAHVVLQLLAGGTVLIGFFMATDYATCPITPKGRILFGIGCGVLTVILRRIGCPGDGAVYAVLIMNLFTGILDRLTRPRKKGEGGEAAS